jgi:hypothetical protein
VANINLSTLPIDILTKIPISLRVAKDEYDVDELPLDIQYLVSHYLETKQLNISYDNVYDAKPEITVYNDLETIREEKKLLLNYFRNYMLTKVGSYPFDPNFGCRLKEQLQTRDTSLRHTLVSNEIELIANVLGNDYNTPINVKEVEIVNEEHDAYVEYNVRIVLEIDSQQFILSTSGG